MKHRELIEKMTLEEKTAFLSGKGEWETREIKRLDIPSVFCSDGPHGIRKQAGTGDHLGLNESLPATCFPTAAAAANSWNQALGEEIGAALGEEAQCLDVDILLGPGLNIKRSPLCGRNFEYFSEDPFLAGKMAAAYIRGIQSRDIYACPKHFAVNNQELRRMAMNAVVDERTLREIYLTGFEIAVKEGHTKAIMTSYNEVNGVYANENKHLLKEILREEWGFDGVVITDWGGSNDHAAGVAAGSDLEMPAPGFGSARELVEAVQTGRLTMDELDACADHLLDAVLTLGSSGNKGKTNKEYDKKQHHNLAKRAAVESIVLLKNDEDILPLDPRKSVAVIGDFAIHPRYQGAGSSVVNANCLETIEQEIQKRDLKVIGVAAGYRRTGEEDQVLRKEAMDIAGNADVVLYCFGLDELSESEGLDRTHMRILQNQIELLESIAKINANIVGIISAGSAIEMPWSNCMKAILNGYLTGQAGASAMLDIIQGIENPSGKLSETYPLRYEDTPAFKYFPSTERTAEYREALYVGYRYYDTARVRVRYPFGFGLSYTTFCYSDIAADEKGVEVTISNIGNRDGAEVVQMYVGLPDAVVFRPAKELKGFQKVFLKQGEHKRIRMEFDDKTFRYWNVRTNSWEMEPGTYQIMIGASIEDIRLQSEVIKQGTTSEYPYDPSELSSYYTGSVQNIGAQEFETLLEKPILSGKWTGKLNANDAVCQMYYAKGAAARFVYNRLAAKKKRSEKKGKPDLNLLFIFNMPFRAFSKMTKGLISKEMTEGILVAVNGRFFKGLKIVICEFVRNKRLNREFEKRLLGGSGRKDE